VAEIYVLSDSSKKFAAKLAPKWIGPLKVKKKVGRVSYLLEDHSGKESGPWHVDQLKPHHGRVTRTCLIRWRGGL